MTFVQPYACLQDVVVVLNLFGWWFQNIELLHRGWIFLMVQSYRIDWIRISNQSFKGRAKHISLVLLLLLR